MAVKAPNASHHHTALGIKGALLTKEKLAQPLIGIRQSNFEDGNEISTETDEGHTGVSNLDMGSYRTKAESAPNWEDGLRFGQGYEDYFYLLLSQDTVAAYNDGTDDVSGIYVHTMAMPSNATDELPLATIYHGFSKTLTDGRIFNNAMLNQVDVTFNADNKPTVKPSFISDYNIVNTINPPREFIDNHLARTVMAQHTKVYVGDLSATTLQEMTEIECFKEASFSINNNAESEACHDDKFGENSKLMGAREATGSITMPWTAFTDSNTPKGTRYFETEFEAYEKYGHIVSEQITQKQIWFQTVGGDILVEEDSDMVSSGVPYESIFKFPVCEVTNVTSTKSGSDAKELTMEFKVIEQPSQSYMTAIFTTDLATCHIDTTGQTRSAVYPPLKDGSNNNIPANQVFAPYASQ